MHFLLWLAVLLHEVQSARSGLSRIGGRPLMAASSTPVSSAPHSPPAAADEAGQFDWYRHWYPINVLETLDPTRPHPAQLLGLNLVIWNDGKTVDGRKESGKWRVFADACPHRMGPLSEGRVEEDGNLLCSYHGWRFNGDGACADLPYVSGPAAERQRCSCKAQATDYPVREADGFLWVFPMAGAEAEREAAEVALPLIDELHDPALEGRWKWKVPAGVRDFPCGWDTMLENTLDPAHFTTAHHGTLGNRYTDPAPYSFETLRGVDAEEGFAVRGDFGRLEFKPPCLVKYIPDYPGMPFNGSLVLATYCVPTRPGWVRPLANVLNDRGYTSGGTLAERALQIFMAGTLPDWLGHQLSSIVLHQDAGLLYKQYRNLREAGYNAGYSRLSGATSNPSLTDGAGTPYEELVYTPTSVDKGVLIFRQWLRTRAGGGVPWACEDVIPPRGTEDIYDMWDAHTKHCTYCQAAYRRIQLGKYASIALLGLAVVALPEATEGRAPLAFALALSAGSLQLLGQLFQRYEFSHADND
jgi:phenylpropionate dioxygenase-like ring-hydroxylating dioxygenase large terminal subunit